MSNQLNGLSFQVQLMQQQLANQKTDNDPVLSLIPGLRRCVDQLCLLLDEFRSLGRPQRLTLQPTNLVQLVTELIQSVGPQYAACGVRVEVYVSGFLPLARIDHQKFKQALLNLFKNAVEAMPEGGTLTVRLYKSRQTICLEIQDSGTGVPEDLDIFEPFSTTKSYGTGLGMAVVRQVVSAHGGTIDYTSEPRKGTTFCLSLPASSSNKAAGNYSVFDLTSMSSGADKPVSTKFDLP
jgi:signal transduction histidine kinase